VEQIVTAIDQVAKSQAIDNFAGTYTSSDGNSSMTISSDDSPALALTAWTWEGRDLYTDLFELLVPDVDIRILPNQLYDGDQVGFTSYYQPPAPDRLFFGSCFSWVDVDELTFGNIPLGQFVFEVDRGGRAVAVESKSLGVRMERAN